MLDFLVYKINESDRLAYLRIRAIIKIDTTKTGRGRVLVNLEILPRATSEKHSDYVYRILRHNILDLLLEPGTALNEQELADCLHVSRTPVREAIFRLKEERLMVTYPQSSSVVALIDLSYMSAIVYLRVAVETKLLLQLCDDISSESIGKLQDNLALQKAVCEMEHVDGALFYRLDQAFHHLLYEAAGQQPLYELLSGRLAYFDRMSCFLLKFGYHNVKGSYQMHQKWFEVIISGAAENVVPAVNTHLCGFWKIKPEHLRYFTSIQEDPHMGVPAQAKKPVRRGETARRRTKKEEKLREPEQ